MQNQFKTCLRENWKIQSSAKITHSGLELSSSKNLSENWISSNVPSTVLGALVNEGIYSDPYFGENLKSIPPEKFNVPWWYICHFELNEEQANDYSYVQFDGVNYKANIWLNGMLIADSDTIDGAYKRIRLQVNNNLISGSNLLAIEVIPPKPGDFSIGFVDWNPAPPDGNMGIFRPVTLYFNKGISIQNPFVQTKVNLETLKEASLSISADLVNHSNKNITGTLKGSIGDITVEKTISINPNSTVDVIFKYKEFSQLKILNPQLWWPVDLGTPHLYQLGLQFEIDSVISDVVTTKFGIREVEDYWLKDIHRGYKINGQKILIKGGGWTDDLFLMDRDEDIEAQVKYVKQLHLNCIRLEGFWGKDHKLYDLCDEYGILLMVGWSCHWEHEIHLGVPVNERYGGVYNSKDIDHVAQAWKDQVIWLRNHPSIFVWTVASDKVPIRALEEKYIKIFEEYDPTRPYLNSTGGVGSDQHVIGSEDVISEISGSSGVKMLGPYAYTAPSYWYTDKQLGGAYGFNTETGPGAQVPQIESLKKMIPEKDLWPISATWDYHCGRYEFSDLNRFVKAINERYGITASLEDFDKKAQALNYELMRPMFEAFRVNKKQTTGIIQWMLNAAWPKMYWQLYDYYLNPTGAFYATQKACTPLHIIYNYGNYNIYIVNEHLQDFHDLKAEIRIYDINSKLQVEKSLVFNVSSDSASAIYKLDRIENISTTYFLDIRLFDNRKKAISTNFYWLSTKEETLDYKVDLGEFAYHTPSKAYADLTLLNDLPRVNIVSKYYFTTKENERSIIVELYNNNSSIAFLINLKLTNKVTGELILPIFWEDNFISLLPNEKRLLKATFQSSAEVALKVTGWNC